MTLQGGTIATLTVVKPFTPETEKVWDAIKYLSQIGDTVSCVKRSILHGRGRGAMLTLYTKYGHFRFKFTFIDDLERSSVFKLVECSLEGIKDFLGHIRLRVESSGQSILEIGCSFIDELNRSSIISIIKSVFNEHIINIRKFLTKGDRYETA